MFVEFFTLSICCDELTLGFLPELWASCWPPRRNAECGPHTTPRSQAPEEEVVYFKFKLIYAVTAAPEVHA